MSFKKEFPSLKGKRLSIDGKIVKYKMKDGRKINVFREIEIEKYCLDKAKVKEVIEKHCFDCAASLKKQLGLK